MTPTIYFIGVAIVATLSGALVFSTDTTDSDDMAAIVGIAILWPLFAVILGVVGVVMLSGAILLLPGLLIGTAIRKLK